MGRESIGARGRADPRAAQAMRTTCPRVSRPRRHDGASATSPVRRARPRRVGRAGARHRARSACAEEIDAAARPRRPARPRRGRAGLPAALPAAQPVRRGRRPAAPRARGVPRPAQPPRTPFVIGARRLGGGRQVDHRPRAAADAGALARAPRVALVTTDGFLLPQRRARAPRAAAPQGLPGVLRPPGAAAVRRSTSSPARTRSRRRSTPTSPTTSCPDETVVVQQPRHPHRRGPQRAPAGPGPRRRPHRPGGQRLLRLLGLRRRRAPSDIRRWYIERFLRLRETAFRDPASYFPATPRSPTTRPSPRRSRIWDDDQRAQPARRTSCPPAAARPWCCARTRDHSVRCVRLRKL